MNSKVQGDKAEWVIRPSDTDLNAGFITKERFIELLSDDLRSGGYKIIKIDGNYMTIKDLKGLYHLFYGPKLPDVIPLPKAEYSNVR